MANLTFKGNQISTAGDLPKVGETAPDFSIIKTDLSEATLKEFAGKRVVLNLFPSIDTPVCAAQTRRFNEEAAKLKNAAILCVSADLPFAYKRFCGAEGIENIICASTFRSGSFHKDRYGMEMTGGPLAGLLARAVVIIDEFGKIAYTDLVAEVTHEPNYDSALAVLA